MVCCALLFLIIFIFAYDVLTFSAMRPEEVALLNKFLHKKVDLMQNSGIDVSLDRSDPRSPLHSIRSFRDLRL